MADFPDMKFILVGDDGQKDPTTYATIARRYPGRVLAIVIRQLSPRESTGSGVGDGHHLDPADARNRCASIHRHHRLEHS